MTEIGGYSRATLQSMLNQERRRATTRLIEVKRKIRALNAEQEELERKLREIDASAEIL